jgi:hypothetical protein
VSDEKTIRPAELARHWNVSKAYVSKLINKKGMPPVTDFKDADAWRALNAPSKPALEVARAAQDQSKSPKNGRDLSHPQHSAGKDSPATEGGDVVDIAPFIARGGDFDAMMVSDAEAMPKIARGLFDRACGRMNVAEIASFLKIWADAAGKASDARQQFLDIQERKRGLISLDEVMDIVGTELQAVRSSLLKLGARIASKANAADPALAQSVIDGEIDSILRNLSTGMELAQTELAEGKAGPESDEALVS